MKPLFKRRTIVTGGVSFIGSNYLNYAVKKYPRELFINVDALTYAADVRNITVQGKKNYVFEKADICDRATMTAIFEKYKPTHLIHFASETHVDQSIMDPGLCLRTNVGGTNELLLLARSPSSRASTSSRPMRFTVSSAKMTRRSPRSRPMIRAIRTARRKRRRSFCSCRTKIPSASPASFPELQQLRAAAGRDETHPEIHHEFAPREKSAAVLGGRTYPRLAVRRRQCARARPRIPQRARRRHLQYRRELGIYESRRDQDAPPHAPEDRKRDENTWPTARDTTSGMRSQAKNRERARMETSRAFRERHKKDDQLLQKD